MALERYLIVNADDFGQSPGVNRGIIQSHERGIVTSTSLMVRWPASAEAALYARNYPTLDVGIHFDFGEWIFNNGEWVALYEVVPLFDEHLVKNEISRQLDAFYDLIGKPPTHIDSHQHAHRYDPVRATLVDIARKLNVPLRRCTPSIRYCGEYYGQTTTGLPHHESISVNKLLSILSALQPGITELSCHPALGYDIDTMYKLEREMEAKVLCDERIRAAVAAMGITLYSFAQIKDRVAIEVA